MVTYTSDCNWFYNNKSTVINKSSDFTPDPEVSPTSDYTLGLHIRFYFDHKSQSLHGSYL